MIHIQKSGCLQPSAYSDAGKNPSLITLKSDDGFSAALSPVGASVRRICSGTDGRDLILALHDSAFLPRNGLYAGLISVLFYSSTSPLSVLPKSAVSPA